MTLSERIEYIDALFCAIQDTSSLNNKRDLLSEVSEEYQDDLNYLLEILNGMHKLGYTFYETAATRYAGNEDITIREYLAPLFEPLKRGDLSNISIMMACAKCGDFAWFVEPIVNRTLKLGIGKSMLKSSNVAPMLAKKYEGKIIQQHRGYFVTEKLDGNRCIAYYNNGIWHFTSRNGKALNVNFDMSNMSVDFVYDGEILSEAQTRGSILLHENFVGRAYKGDEFNATSGRINAKYGAKNLVYNIFDIQLDLPYYARRELLETFDSSSNVRILPVLRHYSNIPDFRENINDLLDYIVGRGAEGLMINLADAPYCNKRTDSLLKYKNVYTLDMEVLDVQDGKGKYEGCIGALNCRAVSDGKIIECEVGSGMTDEQRISWALNPKDIIGKIIEVSYFSMSQSANTNGTKYYSLRFPRMTGIRSDKGETSVY